jgi:hypothetical protein
MPPQQPVSRVRRAIFVFLVMAICLGGAIGLALWGPATGTAENTARGLIGIAQTVVVAYLGASVVDRSDVLGKLGDAAKVRGGRSSSDKG